MTAPASLVWLASYPKSGNTWFRIFLANLAAGENGPTDINNLDERGGLSCSRNEFELATLLDSGLISHDEIDELRPLVYRGVALAAGQRWIKIHDAFTLTTSGLSMFGIAGARAVYLVRDPRDVVISLAFHNNITVDDAINLLNSPDSAFCRGGKGLEPQLRQLLRDWSGNVASWLDQTDIPVLCIRYEDLHREPERHFAEALRFAGRAASHTEIMRAIRHSNFAALQRQEAERGFAECMSKKTPFFRRGRAGEWREQLTSEQVSCIEAAHGRTMLRLGYELDGRPTGVRTGVQGAFLPSG